MNFNDIRNEFISGITKGAFKEFKYTELDIKNKKLFVAAVSQGYDDAKRTFTGISKFWDDQKSNEISKEAFFKFVATKIQNIFQSPPNDFDTQHKNICNDACVWFKENGYDSVTFGQAQKIVNMTFKYLYCLKDADKYNGVFEKCHMPLDSFTLEWYKRYVWKKEEYKIMYNVKWSNLNEYAYRKITDAIKNYLDSNPQFNYKGQNMSLSQNRLVSEFYIWPEMQMHISTEEFLFSFKSIYSKKKTHWKSKSVFEKMDEIKTCIDNYKNPQ